MREAVCSCGQLRIACDGEPVRVSMCHCFACQRRSGSVFAVQARFPDDKVKIEGRATEWTRVGDSGSKITFRFCPTCGTTLYYTMDTQPGLTAVAVGAFANPDFPRPKFSVYEARRHPAFPLPDDVEHMD